MLVPPVLSIKPKKSGHQETKPKKATTRRQLLEKHTLGWTPKEEEHPDEGPSSPKSELAGKGKEKPGKKTTQTKEPAEEGPVLQKPIKIKVRRLEPEPDSDFVQKIRLGTTIEEEAEEEEPTETLE